MKAADLVYRGYAKREGALWVAVCLDFCLAAQADTAEEATQKLSRQIQDYIYDAIAGGLLEDDADPVERTGNKASTSSATAKPPCATG